MPKSCLTLASVLALLVAANSLAPAADDIKFKPLHFCDDMPDLAFTERSSQPSEDSGTACEEPPTPGKMVTVGKAAKAEVPPLTLYDFVGYRYILNPNWKRTSRLPVASTVLPTSRMLTI